MKRGDLVETFEFGVGIVLEVTWNQCRIFYPSGKWYWEEIRYVELISEI